MPRFTKTQIFSALDKLGEENARARIALGYFGRVGSKRRALANEWVRLQALKRNSASNSEMASIASRAATAAERAAAAAEAQATAAKLALITAITAAIISAVALAESTFKVLSKWF